MTAMKANLTAMFVCAFVFGAPMVHHVWAVPCNSQTPTLGNCGTESQCEVRAAMDCMTSFGKYYEPQGGIACQSGGSDSYCAQASGAGSQLKCTCEWICKVDPMTLECAKGVAHIGSDRRQICSTMTEYRSQSCTTGGGH